MQGCGSPSGPSRLMVIGEEDKGYLVLIVWFLENFSCKLILIFMNSMESGMKTKLAKTDVTAVLAAG